MEVAVGEPQLWWPRGYGAPPLFEVRAARCPAPGEAHDEAGGAERDPSGHCTSVMREVGMWAQALVRGRGPAA